MKGFETAVYAVALAHPRDLLLCLLRGFVQKIRERMQTGCEVHHPSIVFSRCIAARLQVHFVQDLFPTDLVGVHHWTICFGEPQAWRESDACGRHHDVFMSYLQLHLLHVQAHYQCLGLHVTSQSTGIILIELLPQVSHRCSSEAIKQGT